MNNTENYEQQLSALNRVDNICEEIVDDVWEKYQAINHQLILVALKNNKDKSKENI